MLLNSATFNKCRLVVLYQVRNQRFEPINKDLGDDFVGYVTIRDEPELPNIVMIPYFKDQEDGSSIDLVVYEEKSCHFDRSLCSFTL